MSSMYKILDSWWLITFAPDVSLSTMDSFYKDIFLRWQSVPDWQYVWADFMAQDQESRNVIDHGQQTLKLILTFFHSISMHHKNTRVKEDIIIEGMSQNGSFST